MPERDLLKGRPGRPGLADALRTAVLVGGVLSAAGPASDAAEDPDPDFSLKDTVQAGPLHIAPFFNVKDFGYDDNVRLNAEQRTGDYTVTIAPGARAVVPFGRMAAVAVWEQIDYAVFARESDLNHVNNTLRTKVHVYLRDVTLFADGQQESFRERPNTEIDFRIRTTTTQGRFGLSYRPASRARFDLYLLRTGYRYDAGRPEVTGDVEETEEELGAVGDVFADILRRDETTAVLSGRVKVRPRTSLLAEVSSGRIDFDRTEPERDSSTVTALGGLEFDPAGPVRGTLKAGVKHLSPEDDAVDGYSGLVADASLAMRVLGRGDVKALWERQTGFSVLGENLFHVREKVGLSYEHYVTGRLSFELGRSFYDVDYPLPIDLGGGEIVERRDEIVSDSAAVRYRLGPTLKVGLAVGRWDRDSTLDFEDTTRNTITTLLEYTP